jgi:hypothetical protein
MAIRCRSKLKPLQPLTTYTNKPNITLPQIFPTRIREIGTSVGVSTQWLFNFMYSLVTPYMIAKMGSYVFVFYAALDVTMAALVYFFLEETKGKSIEEMETIFHSRAAFDVDAVHRKAIEAEEAVGVHVEAGKRDRVDV